MSKKDSNSETSEKVVAVSRSTKVVKGGRKFSFSVTVVSADGKGRVGYGLGKAPELIDAKNKAVNKARKSMIKVPMKEGRTLHYDIDGRSGASYVIIRSAPPGTGIIAGGPARDIFEVLGIKDVVAKSIGSNNPHNFVKAVFNAFESIVTPKMIADKRGKKVSEILYKKSNSTLVSA